MYQSADPEQLRRTTEEYERQLAETRENAKKWEGHRKEYTALKTKLDSLSDVSKHQVMVPMTKKAFMPGELVHTNEIMVLLGDNYFAQRSSKQAAEICGRRIDQCEEMLDKLRKEYTLLESWRREMKQLADDAARGEGNIEIREPFDEAEEERWKERHRESVRRSKQNKKETKENDDFDDELERRFAELEIEEELDEHLEREKAKQEAEERFLEPEGNVLDVVADQEEPKVIKSLVEEVVPEQIHPDEGTVKEPGKKAKKKKRRVGFSGDDSEHTFSYNTPKEAETVILEFDHTPAAVGPASLTDTDTCDMSPAHLGRAVTKSILKKSAPIEKITDEELSKLVPDERPVKPPPVAVEEMVYERDPMPVAIEAPKATRPKSKFRQAREKNS